MKCCVIGIDNFINDEKFANNLSAFIQKYVVSGVVSSFIFEESRFSLRCYESIKEYREKFNLKFSFFGNIYTHKEIFYSSDFDICENFNIDKRFKSQDFERNVEMINESHIVLMYSTDNIRDLMDFSKEYAKRQNRKIIDFYKDYL